MSEGTIEDRVARFLLQYRVTPHTTTGCSPAELLSGRKLRTRLDAIKPNLGATVEAKQQSQKEHHDKKSRDRTLQVKDKVFACNFGRGKPWSPGLILRKSGPLSFMVKLTDGRVVRRHCNHLRERTGELEMPPHQSVETDDDALLFESPDLRNCVQNRPALEVANPEESVRRYPSRERRPPDRYEPS